MEEWKEYKLGDLIDFISGGTPNKNTPKFWDGDIPWISAKTMYVDFVSTSDLFISQEGLEAGSKLAPKGTILLLTRGSGLFNTIPICKVVSPVAFNQDVKCLYSKNEDLISNDFLFYWLKGNEQTITNILETTSIGAGKIDTKRFLDLPINLPSLVEQDKLVKIASSLFEKIKINNAINDNLEHQAQALFKSWFVDFEPFRDQSFVESELGMIPDGWRVGTLNNICTTNRRKLKGQITRPIKYLDTGNITKNKIEILQSLNPNIDTIPSRARRCVTEGDIVYSTVRPNQEHYGFLINPPSDLIVSTGFCVITSNWSVYRYYIYQYLIQDSIIATLQAIAEQQVSTYPSLNASDIENLLVVIPPIEVAEKYAKIVLPLYLKMEENQSESHRLSQLRDTLLPKLMSGEIKL